MDDLKPGLLPVHPEPLVCPCPTPTAAIRTQDGTSDSVGSLKALETVIRKWRLEPVSSVWEHLLIPGVSVPSLGGVFCASKCRGHYSLQRSKQ